MLWNRRLKQQHQQRLNHSSAGLTLIECLVAVAVIALSGAVIAPGLIVAVATRVQSQRAEQALQVAQGEIDRVRQVVEQGSYSVPADLGVASTTTTVTAASTPDDVPSTAFTLAGSDPYRKARSVDVDRDGEFDFAVQAYRTEGRLDASGRPVIFEMGVRVYDYNAVINNADSLETAPSRLGQTSGEGQRGQRPLAALYTSIVKSDERQSLCEYFRSQSTAGSVPGGVDCS